MLSSMAPVVGVELTATLADPDMVTEDTVTWQWSKSMTMDGIFEDIDEATMMTYTPVAADDGYYLMAEATYTDGLGSGKSAMKTTDEMVSNLVVSGMSTVDYSENGTDAVDTYMVTGTGAASATWTLEGDDAGDFMLEGTGMSRMLKFSSAPDIEMPMGGADNDSNTYMVTVKAEAGGVMAMQPVTVTVTNVEETGEVTLWAGMDALTMAPQVGETITGAVMDPDGGVTGETWQWARTTTPDMMASWMDIAGETNADYMVAAGDTGHYLRVMATYTDAVGTDMDMEYSMPTMMVVAEAEDTLLAEYDANRNGQIDKSEVIKAINDYLFGEVGIISKADVIRLINLYLFG